MECFICRRQISDLSVEFGDLILDSKENYRSFTIFKYDPKKYMEDQEESIDNEKMELILCIFCYRLMKNVGPEFEKKQFYVYEASLDDFF